MGHKQVKIIRNDHSIIFKMTNYKEIEISVYEKHENQN